MIDDSLLVLRIVASDMLRSGEVTAQRFLGCLFVLTLVCVELQNKHIPRIQFEIVIHDAIKHKIANKPKKFLQVEEDDHMLTFNDNLLSEIKNFINKY